MPRPALPPDEKRVSVSVLLAPETVERLAALAEARGCSRGKLLDDLVARAAKPRRKRPAAGKTR